ncbi:MAG: YggS family pyridoxal phosphate-dependent enzyme [Acholeplasmatales bacterium]|nr:MAG: YggS family pyridoxal phosphate-dependent enzyme [Acholeplasmatales bacterium]
MNRALLDWLSANYPDVAVVMASKYLTDAAAFKPFIEAGILDFGENRAEALLEKKAWFKDQPIRWHYIGTLQTKKVRKVIEHIDVLHALDRLKLAEAIETHRTGVLPCYVQVNISNEPQKQGVAIAETVAFVKQLSSFKHLRVIGLMGMAEETEDTERIRAQFNTLRQLRDEIHQDYPDVRGLSMGMTQDYHIALELGSSVLRLGRILLAGESYGT